MCEDGGLRGENWSGFRVSGFGFRVSVGGLGFGVWESCIPVLALPMTSLPASACGIVARCTSVMVTKFAFLRALCVLKERGRSANSRAAA